MNNLFSKIIKSIIIATVTLLCGFGITALTFNLSDTVSTNELRILFVADFLLLCVIGGAYFYAFESKSKKQKKKNEFKQRHDKRVMDNFRQYNGLDMSEIYSSSYDFVA